MMFAQFEMFGTPHPTTFRAPTHRTSPALTDKNNHNVHRNRYPALQKGRNPFQYLEDSRRKTKNSTLMGIEPTISAFHKREVTLVGGQRGTFSPQGQIVVRFPNYNVLYPTAPRHAIENRN